MPKIPKNLKPSELPNWSPQALAELDEFLTKHIAGMDEAVARLSSKECRAAAGWAQNTLDYYKNGAAVIRYLRGHVRARIKNHRDREGA